MRATSRRLFQLSRPVFYHENPLGLPRSGTPPSWPRRVQRRHIRGVDKLIAVSSAKGGVGKSTIAANLSLAFARLGLRSGILDTDIFGPSIPTLFDLSGEPRLSAQNQLLPLVNYGVKTMSMGYLVGDKAPVVWRGPMVMKAVQQLLHQVEWGGLDVLVLDLPPGTGDTQLTITQQVALDGSIIVSTPHTLSTKDAIKGINMFKTVDTKILGLVQNMSVFTCPHCHEKTNIFGSKQMVERLCREHEIDLLGDIPLHPNIGEDGDRGKPTVVSEPTSDRAFAFLGLAQTVGRKVGILGAMNNYNRRVKVTYGIKVAKMSQYNMIPYRQRLAHPTWSPAWQGRGPGHRVSVRQTSCPNAKDDLLEMRTATRGAISSVNVVARRIVRPNSGRVFAHGLTRTRETD